MHRLVRVELALLAGEYEKRALHFCAGPGCGNNLRGGYSRFLVYLDRLCVPRDALERLEARLLRGSGKRLTGRCESRRRRPHSRRSLCCQ